MMKEVQNNKCVRGQTHMRAGRLQGRLCHNVDPREKTLHSKNGEHLSHPGEGSSG